LLEVPASLDGVDRAVETARAFFARSTGGTKLYPVLAALREALLNACMHGCGLNPSLTVRCELAVEDGAAVVTVRDPGPGFGRKQAAPAAPSPEALSGRGMAMMNLYSQKLEYNEQGNEVRLRIELDAGS